MLQKQRNQFRIILLFYAIIGELFEMHRVFKKEQILTIPNFLSILRLLLIPLIAWLYVKRQAYWIAVGVLILSGVTDIADGIIARRYNMVSDFGKILDPVADKLTQAAVLFCLMDRYRLMMGLIILFAAKELCMAVMGYVAIKKKDAVNGAKWYGKVNTVVLYALMLALMLFPGMPEDWASVLILLCGCVQLVSLVLYVRFYRSILR